MVAVLIYIFLNFLIGVESQSFLNVDELSLLQYGLEIANEPVLFKEHQEENVMHISSKYGQLYSCKLPESLPSKTEIEQIDKVDPKSVISILDKRFNETCERFNKGWWSYKVCHKKNVTQYHIGEKGEIEGEVTLLGVYDKEDDWSDKNLSDHKTRELYHSVNYVNGSLCDLTSKPRKTAVQYYCGEINDMILRVEEPATCEYIITVHSKGLCKHPAFKTEAKTRKFDLVCAPALREKAFNRYQQRKQEELDKKRAEEEQERLLKEKEKEEKLKMEKEESSKLEETMTEKESGGKWMDVTKGLKDLMSDLLGEFDPNKMKQDLNLNNKLDHEEESDLLQIDKNDLNIDDREDDPWVLPDKKTDDKLNSGDKAILTNSDDKHFINTDKLQESVAEMIAKLGERDHSLSEAADKEKQALEDEYLKTKEFTEKELEKSRSNVNSLKKMLGSVDENERKDLQEMIKNLEKNNLILEDQITSMNTRMEKVRQLESETEKKLRDLDSQLSQTKIIQAVTEKLKNIQVKGKDKVIADTVSKIFGKANEKLAKRRSKGQQTASNNILEKNNENKMDIEDKREDKKTKKESLFDKLKQEISKMNKEILKDKKDGSLLDSDEDALQTEAADDKKESLKVRVRSLSDEDLDKELEKDMENLDENTRADLKAATKEMEEAVRKQLKEAGIDLTDNIKIKVITTPEKFEKMKGKEILSKEDAADFKDLFLNFMGGGQEKRKEEKRQKSLQESYEQVWDDNEQENPPS